MNFIARGFVPETINDPRNVNENLCLCKFKFNCLEYINFGRQNISRDGSISNYRFTIITNENFYGDYKFLDKNYKIGDNEHFNESNYAQFPINDNYQSGLKFFSYNEIENCFIIFIKQISCFKRG